ncbi:hypothetical protein POM88_045533 [Heracleum sosnowskyi]|uniref:Response regulatory domain-containing protein n=1 Tax=Heracleum sosnowskyi TaxID=360622 RepID=A0AAD8H5V3_9APIA|nr:hypothetical protein POM88_045533 [Heracleum sosnowskyi]
MYKVLVVDDDETSLTVARACLRTFDYYEVRAVTHALEALSLLCDKREGEKSYDVILADVHMPIMNGFELMHRVNNNFNIPVVLISADDKKEVIRKGLGSGAPAYLLKPVTTNSVKHLWQYSVLWKNKERNAYRRFNRANVPRNICSSSSSIDTQEVSREKKTKEIVWNANLHSRFVEAILILGHLDAIPRNILKVMNVSSVSREQVASHLQKFRKFLEKVLDGEKSLHGGSKYWIDCNYYSRIVGGNPNVIFLNQLREQRRTGKIQAAIPASLPLPPFNEHEASLSGSRNVEMSILLDSYASSSFLNVATSTPSLANVSFQSAGNVCIPNYRNEVPQQNYHTSLSVVNEGLIGGTNNNMFSSLNHMVHSSGTTHISNQFMSEQLFDMVSEDNNNLFDENNFNNPVLQVEDEQINDQNIRNLFDANQFGIPLRTNNEQLESFPNLFNGYRLGNTNQQVGSVPFGGTTNEFENASAMPVNGHAPQFGGYMQMADGRKEDSEDE